MLHSWIEAPRSLLAHLSVTPWLAALIEFDGLRCIGLGRHTDWSGIDGDSQGMKRVGIVLCSPTSTRSQPIHQHIATGGGAYTYGEGYTNRRSDTQASTAEFRFAFHYSYTHTHALFRCCTRQQRLPIRFPCVPIPRPGGQLITCITLARTFLSTCRLQVLL
jgi:hypothetical protein